MLRGFNYKVDRYESLLYGIYELLKEYFCGCLNCVCSLVLLSIGTSIFRKELFAENLLFF